MIKSLIIAVDFDDTLFTNNYPDIGEPIWNTINWCKKQKSHGNRLILWTCREGYELSMAVEACKQVGVIFDAINEDIKDDSYTYSIPSRKILADIYVDDKALNTKDLLYYQI